MKTLTLLLCLLTACPSPRHPPAIGCVIGAHRCMDNALWTCAGTPGGTGWYQSGDRACEHRCMINDAGRAQCAPDLLDGGNHE